MSIGTKVKPNALTYYDEIVKLLIANNMTFFTHPVRDSNNFKLMLFGLPRISTTRISEEFKTKFNIVPISVKEIQTNRSSKDDALYMLEFNKSQISKREVRKIRYFCGIVVQ